MSGTNLLVEITELDKNLRNNKVLIWVECCLNSYFYCISKSWGTMGWAQSGWHAVCLDGLQSKDV